MLILSTLSACVGLGGEPEIVATVPPAETTQRAIIAASEWQPDIENGARIFAERCVDCHGVSGDGLGALVLAGSVERPLDMTERAQVASKSPLEWFEIITEGSYRQLDAALGECPQREGALGCGALQLYAGL